MPSGEGKYTSKPKYVVSNANPPSSNADFDSGWLTWQTASQLILQHNLETEELFVYVMYKNGDGLVQTCTMLVQWWALNEQSISVNADLTLGQEFRILIWKLPNIFNKFQFLSGPNDPI